MNLFINSFTFEFHCFVRQKLKLIAFCFELNIVCLFCELIFLEYTIYRDVYNSGHETIYFSGEAHEY